MQRFKSKVGLELVILLVLPSLYAGYELTVEQAWIGFAVLLPILAFLAHMVATTYYTVSGQLLIIKCGLFFTQKLPIASIRRLSQSSDLTSAPALSIDRIEILYNKFDTVLVSPKDKPGFLKAIKQINPEVEIRGIGL